MFTEPNSTGFDDVFVDWGNNPISNGGNNASQYKWRTLEAGQTDGGEWEYLLERRLFDNRFAYAEVCGVNGLVIFPDGWDKSSSSFTFDKINENQRQYRLNTIDATVWGALHEEGCVFLPAVGRKTGSGIWDEPKKEGRYWANGISNKKNESQSLYFATNAWNPGKNSERKYGYSVRLVMDVPASNN